MIAVFLAPATSESQWLADLFFLVNIKLSLFRALEDNGSVFLPLL